MYENKNTPLRIQRRRLHKLKHDSFFQPGIWKYPQIQACRTDGGWPRCIGPTCTNVTTCVCICIRTSSLNMHFWSISIFRLVAQHSPTPRSQNRWLFATDSGCLIRRGGWASMKQTTGKPRVKGDKLKIIAGPGIFRQKASLISIILTQRITTVLCLQSATLPCYAMFETRCWALCRRWKQESFCGTCHLKMVLWQN